MEPGNTITYMQMFIRNEIVENSASISQPEKKNTTSKPDQLEVVHSTRPMFHAFAIWAWAFLGYFQRSGSSTATDPCCGTHLLWRTYQFSTWSHHSRMHSPDSLSLEINDIYVSVTLFTDKVLHRAPRHMGSCLRLRLCLATGFGDGIASPNWFIGCPD